jgi:cyclopropane fatty-acyl-phospholipid synthase-like methyltransferase
MAAEAPGKEHFQDAYEGKAPWDIGRPQPVFVQAAEQITGSLLDAGCGTGENALFFAESGHRVTGIDFLEKPIAEAQRKSQRRGLQATFLVMDALALGEIPEQFDSVIDCGLFHVFPDDERARYVTALASVIKPGGKLFLCCFSDKEPPGHGPRRVSQRELHDAFAHGWQIESIREARFETRTDLEGVQFSEGGPRAWFCVIQKSA